jgi:CCR4-NOT transcription complex subunit 1
MAIDKAIKEILTPVMERSATIASITTRELVLKDFALEPDEQIMRTAAHYTVQSLASSLAMVACKEPLRVSIASHLRSLLQANVTDQVRSIRPSLSEFFELTFPLPLRLSRHSAR